jgi:hypothetical protein
MTNRGKRSKFDTKIEMFSDAYIKIEEYLVDDYYIKPRVNHKHKLTSKKGATRKNKIINLNLSQYPRRNSTRVSIKYRLKSKAMFDPSIKEENEIVIEDHYEETKVCVKEKAERPPLHRKLVERGKKIAKFLAGLVNRATTRLSKAEALAKGTRMISENK